MKRREFLALVGGAAAAFPFDARAQQQSIPVIGFLDPRSLEGVTNRLRGLRQGLKETGHVEGENVTIEYRLAENQMDRLPELAADLVRRRAVVIIASGGLDATLATKAATTTIPIVFLTGEDPVRLGLVTSLARPDGNLTGINFFNTELATKRLELLRELVPGAKRIAVLVNPVDTTNTDSTLRAIEPAARAIGLQIQNSHCQHKPRDRCGFCCYRARPARRHLRRTNSILELAARAIGAIGRSLHGPCLIPWA